MNYRGIGILFISIALIVSIILAWSADALRPAGYELAVDGYLVSRTLVILFILSVIVQIGFKLLDKK